MPSGVYERTPELLKILSAAQTKRHLSTTTEQRKAQMAAAVEASRLRPVEEKIKDRVGESIGKWTVISFMGVEYGSAKWLIRCGCGTERVEFSCDMGRSKSCGCARRDAIKNGSAVKTAIWCGYKSIARKRKLCWELTREQFDIRTSENCFYCGVAPSNKRRNRAGGPIFTYSGIDRQDNNIGYTFENTVSCCRVCNHAKKTMSVENFLNWIKRVYEHSAL